MRPLERCTDTGRPRSAGGSGGADLHHGDLVSPRIDDPVDTDLWRMLSDVWQGCGHADDGRAGGAAQRVFRQRGQNGSIGMRPGRRTSASTHRTFSDRAIDL